MALDVRAALTDLRATTTRHRLTAVGLRTAATAVRVVTATRSPVASARPRRKGLILLLAAVASGLGVVVVSTDGRSSGPAEFRSPPVVTAESSAAGPPVNATQPGLAPYQRPSAAGSRPPADSRKQARGGRNGSAAAEPSATARRARVLPGVSARAAQRVPARTTSRAGGVARSGLTEKAASITIEEPGDGAIISGSSAVRGTADLPEGHQVWLLWRQGSTGAHQVAGVCRGTRAFACGSVALTAGGDDTFVFTAVVVDPMTAATLDPATARDSLPAHVARSEVTVRRATA